MGKCLSKELIYYFNGGYLEDKTSIIMHLKREERKLIRELLNNLSIDPRSKSFDYDELVKTSLQLMITSLHEIHPLLAKVFQQICVPYLPGYEKNVREILTSHQDHIVHSINLYILGLYLADRLKIFKNSHINYIRNDLIFAERNDAIFGSIDRREFESYTRPSFALKEFLHRWKITAFFHDNAYPAEICTKLMEHWFDDILDGERQGDSEKLLTYRLNVINKFFKLEIPQNPSYPFPNFSRMETDIFFIFSQRLSHAFFPDFQVETIKDILYDNFYKMSLHKGFVEHGFFSALIFTYMLHLEIKNESKKFSDQIKQCSGNRKDFHSKRYELTTLYLRGVDAGTAILLHNLQHFKHPAFKNKKIESREYPLAFMLKLCDELQVWNRYKGDLDKNIAHDKLNSLREVVGDELNNFDLLSNNSKKRYLNLALEEKFFCIDNAGKIKINNKVKDKILRKILVKLFPESTNDKELKRISDIQNYIDDFSKIFNKKDQCDLKNSRDGKKYFELIKKNSKDSNVILLLAAVIYKLYLSETEIIDDNWIDLNKRVDSLEHLKDFIEKCLQEFCWDTDKIYSSDYYYLKVGTPDSQDEKNEKNITIRYPNRNEAIKKARLINKVLKLSGSKEDLVIVAVDKKQLLIEQNFLFEMLREMIQCKNKMEGTNGKDNPRNS